MQSNKSHIIPFFTSPQTKVTTNIGYSDPASHQQKMQYHIRTKPPSAIN
jgi:hypothetical protein